MTLVQRLVMLVVIMVAPVLAAVTYSLGRLNDLLTHEISADIGRAVAQVDTQNRHLREAVGLLLDTVAMQAPRAASDTEACANLLSRLEGQSWRWLDVMVLDRAGTVRCSTLPGTIGADRASEPEVQEARASGTLVLGQLRRQDFQPEASLQAARAWSGPNGNKDDASQGVVLAIVRPATFLAPLIIELLPPDGAMLMVDRAGRVLFGVPALPAGNGAGVPPALADMLRRPGVTLPDGFRAVWPDGSERLTVAAPASGPVADGLSIAVGIPVATALGGLEAVAGTITWAMRLTLVATVLLAWWGGQRYIRRPLGILTAAALRWRDGDRTTRVRLPGRSEIAALGRVFDEMADATEQGEHQLRETAELLNAVIESSADAIFVKDRAGRYVLANSTFARIIGHERDSLVGLRDADVLPVELRAQVERVHTEVLNTHAPQMVDITMRVADGADSAPRVLQTIYAPILGADGAVSAVAGISRDMTDDRRAAAELRAAKERAEATDESKTRFLAAASHDLRQPVQAAILFAGLIGEHAPENLRKPAEQLRLVLNDLRTMLDSLFDLSRYDTQAMRADIAAFPLQPLIDQSVAAIAGNARAKGLAVEAPATALWVKSDHALLGRMLGNIVQNAVRYTMSGHVRIAVTARNNTVMVEVSDTGPGIAAEDLSRIWQEFEQLHNSERDRRQGLGLGLAIVRRLSRILGHKVSVRSLPGQGTTFSIELPRAEPVQSAVPAREPEAVGMLGGERVAVVVEDDPPLLAVLGMILEDQGWHSIGAADIEEALALLRVAPRPPDVILSDYRLRDGKLGTQAIADIRTQLGRLVPAIILTGDVSGADAAGDGPLRDAERLGEVTVLRKPVAASELADAMDRAIAAVAG